MVAKNKKIIIGLSVTVVAAGIAYLVYKRKKNKESFDLMLEFINELPKVNTTESRKEYFDKSTEDALKQIDTTDMTRIPTKEFIIDGVTYKSIKEVPTNKMIQIVNDLNKSFSGAGTDLDLFGKTFTRLGNRSSMIFANTLYKQLHKETMWDAIRGEKQLYGGLLNKFVPGDLANYNLGITKHLNNIIKK